MVALGVRAWLLGGHAWLLRGGMCGCSGGACMVAWGHAWLLQGGMHGCSGGHAWFYLGGVHVFFSFFGYNEIQSMSRQYISYWNAFLLSHGIPLDRQTWLKTLPHCNFLVDSNEQT